MPSSFVFFPYCRVLGAVDRPANIVASNTDVAPDAFTNVVDPTLFDFLWEERVGDRRAGGSDQIENAALDLRYHRVGRREPADADDRLCRNAFHIFCVRLLIAFLCETA